jgi:hypothetical protein
MFRIEFWKSTILLLVMTILAACGTFEIGIENNVVPETQEQTPIATQAQPVDQNVDLIETPPIATPVPSDEQLIAAALAEKFNQPAEQLGISFAAITADHAKGGISNGYFLAVKQGNGWMIVYDGQATPPCREIEQYRFPIEMVPECLDDAGLLVMRTGGDDAYSQAINSLQSLDCRTEQSSASVIWVACNIQDALRSRNISTLLSYLEDPFIIGYWLSEGVFYSPEDFVDLLPQLYNFNDPDYTPRLTFTTDRSQFPELDGRPLEDRFGPDVNVVEVIYSEGWGAEGDQETLIFISQDSAGDYKWHSMLTGDLDVPMP